MMPANATDSSGTGFQSASSRLKLQQEQTFLILSSRKELDHLQCGAAKQSAALPPLKNEHQQTQAIQQNLLTTKKMPQKASAACLWIDASRRIWGAPGTRGQIALVQFSGISLNFPPITDAT